MKSDVINTKLKEVLTSENYIIYKFKRYAWEGMFILDLNTKSLISITSISNLNIILIDKNRKVPHYMQSILNCLNNDIEANKQMSFELGKTFDNDVYEKDFKNIFYGLNIDFEEYTYYVVAYDYKFNKVSEMNWYLLGNEFNVAEKESIISLINPDFLDLTSSENESDDKLTNKEDNKSNKGISLASAENKYGKDTTRAKQKIEEIKQKRLLGVELNAEMYTLAAANMILRGDGSSNIQKGNTFKTPEELYTNFKED